MPKEVKPEFLSKDPPLAKAPLIKKSPLGPVIFIIGPPGSGKGTLCSRICAEFPGRFKHLSVGDFLREKFCNHALPPEDSSSPSSPPASDPGCLTPYEIAEYVREGRLLPPKTLIPLLKDKMVAEDPSRSMCWLLDGFPRDLKTAIVFENEASIYSPTALRPALRPFREAQPLRDFCVSQDLRALRLDPTHL